MIYTLFLARSGAEKWLRQIESDTLDKDSALFENLKSMLERLATLAGIFGKPVPCASLLEGPLVLEHVPFSCIAEARNTLLQLMAQCHALNREAYAFAGGRCSANSLSSSYRAMVPSND